MIKQLPFSEVVKDCTGGNPKVKKGDYLSKGLVPIIDQGQSEVGGYINDQGLICNVDLPCIIFGDHTKVLKYIDYPFVLGADGIKVLKPVNKFDVKFVYYYLKIINLPNDVGYSRHFKYLKRASIPLPTLEEQKRIAAILDKADAIRRKREKAIELADEFLKSIFLDMFGDPATNPKGWTCSSIKEMGIVKTGNTPSRSKAEFYGSYIEWIKSDNINTPFHFLTKANERLSIEGLKVGREVPKNSILVTCIAGSYNCIGNAALANRKVAFNQQINAIIPYEKIDPYFLYVQILVAKRQIQRASTNSMKGMVSKGNFEKILLMSPPSILQKKFGDIFHKFYQSNETLTQNYEESKMLFKSLSQRAFRGDL